MLRSARNEDDPHEFASRDAMRPRFELNFHPPRDRGCREDRVRAAPAVSCAICTRRCAHEHTGSAGASRPSLRHGFTAYSALSPVTGFLATVASRALPQNLAPASGRQDHTISPYVRTCVRLSQASRPPHLTARFVTIASRPSSGEMGEVKPVICPTTEGGIFFVCGLDRILPVGR